MNNSNLAINLYEEKIINPISILIQISFCGIIILLSTYFFEINSDFNFSYFLLLGFCIIFGNFLSVKRCTILQKNKLIKGIKLEHIGFIKIYDEIALNEITEIKIIQNEKKYFEIVALSKYGRTFIIKSNPNKFPAEAELHEIKKLVL